MRVEIREPSGSDVRARIDPDLDAGVVRRTDTELRIGPPVVTGGLTRTQVLEGFAWQIGYVALLWALYRVEWHVGLRSYGASGA